MRKSFVKGQVWNPSQWTDPEYDKKMDAVYRTSATRPSARQC